MRNASRRRSGGLPADILRSRKFLWPLGSDFKRDVTCGQNQSLTVKSVHKLMTKGGG